MPFLAAPPVLHRCPCFPVKLFALSQWPQLPTGRMPGPVAAVAASAVALEPSLGAFPAASLGHSPLLEILRSSQVFGVAYPTAADAACPDSSTSQTASGTAVDLIPCSAANVQNNPTINSHNQQCLKLLVLPNGQNDDNRDCFYSFHETSVPHAQGPSVSPNVNSIQHLDRLGK